MDKIREILMTVEKPSRYTGGEFGELPLKEEKFNFCMCFPDVYEVAMSNIGIRIIDDLLNKMDDVCCDRCFTPWVDFGSKLRENDIPLYSLTLKKPLKDFDMLAFSFQYELSYTNFLHMLDLAGIPLRSKDRDESYPIIEGGGPCSVNLEPIADFLDLVVIGDGEQSMQDLASLHLKSFATKKEYLIEASKIQGVYVPSLLDVEYLDDGKIKGFSSDVKIKKAMIKNLNDYPFPTRMLVPNVEAVHDRAIIEVMRGCSHGCRFCQAGFIYRPVRERETASLIEMGTEIVDRTGYDELSLNSLSTGDFSGLRPLIKGLKENIDPNCKLALPSLRIDSFEGDFALESRKTSLTFAPEAGTQRLRDVINKDVTEEEIMRGVKESFKLGFASCKLYFMLGLPTETMEDLEGIVDICKKIKDLYFTFPHKKRLRISVSVSTFIPKPFTPFQWEKQAGAEEVAKKQDYLKEKLKRLGVSLSWSDYRTSRLEAVMARGDRKLSKVIETAYKNGAFFDGWTEFFKPDIWDSALKICNIDDEFYIRERDESEILPWDYADIMVSKKFLLKEREKSRQAEVTGNCKLTCKACGMEKFYDCN